MRVELGGQNRYALLIEIGEYPEDSGGNTIHGNNDVSIIKTNLIGVSELDKALNTVANSNSPYAEIAKSY